MRSITMAAIVAMLFAGTALGQTNIAYELELGGDNHAADWENATRPAFTAGSAADGATFAAGDEITWDATVTVTGTHTGTADESNGAANLVFTLELTGPAPSTDLAQVSWYSTINDGDNDGLRGFLTTDPLENASFPLSFDVDANDDSTPDGNGPGRVWDVVSQGGPHMDRIEFPSANMNAITAAAHPVGNTAAAGKLVGMGCGYSQFNGAANGAGGVDGTEVAGVGIDPFGVMGAVCYRGTGIVPIFEGQIDTTSLNGQYTLTLVPGNGNNVLWGNVDCIQQVNNFATAVDNAPVGDAITFYVEGGVECTINSWASVAPHGALGTGAIPLDDTNGIDSECRYFPTTPHVIRVQLTSTGAPTVSGTVQAVDTNTAATFNGTTSITDNGGGSYTLDITFSPALPSTAPSPAVNGCYRIDLASNLACLTGDTDMVFKVTRGDANGTDGKTLLNDFALVKLAQPVYSINVADLSQIRKDINRDGNILLNDAVIIKTNLNNGNAFGVTATCP